MANIKVSEMTEATSFDDGDYTMILQANQNKKISHENILGNIKNNISTINNNIGNLSNLETDDKTSIVNSINELKNAEIYSTEEIKTNKIWIDNKPIYRKVIDFGAFPNTSDKYVDLNINDLDFIVSFQVLGYDTTNKNYFPIPNALTTGSPNLIDASIIGNQIRIRTQSNRSTFIAYPILEYTKTTD